MDRKKLYHKRTMEEVAKRYAFKTGRMNDPASASDAVDSVSNADTGENEETSKQTVDTAIDTTRYTRREAAEVLRSYSKKLQKEKIKRDYAKNLRDAQRASKTAGKNAGKAGKKAAEETESVVSAVMQKISEFLAEHPVGTILGSMVLIILLAFTCTLNSCGMIFGGVSGTSVSSTYTAEDADIQGAEADYKAKEAELQTKMNNIRSLYPGFNEYRTAFGSTGHDAWHLASVLTVIHQNFTRAGVQGTLSSLFAAQYSFTVTTQKETRYRTEQRTGYNLVYDYDDDGVCTGSHYEPYTYEVQVPYEYKILIAKMVNNGLDNVISNLGLCADDLELYEYLNQTKGDKAHLFN